MCEIEKLLKINEIVFFKKGLSWGAKLSSYNKELKKYSLDPLCSIYGIELSEDVNPPLNYISIDHHNELLYDPSSLEKVLKILGLKMTPYLRFVSVNDKAYIKGMLDLKLDQKELKSCCNILNIEYCNNIKEKIIKKIRFLDRRCQGVTNEHEKIAEYSIINNITYKNGYTCVKTDLAVFAPIVDRLYPKDNIVIYNDKSFCYYGSKYLEIKNILDCGYYYGGQIRGFIGNNEELNIDKIEEIISKMTHKKSIYSTHSFLYPFSWHSKDCIDKFIKKLDKEVDNKWKYSEFETKRSEDYNEYNYFHAHVRDALYNTSGEIKPDHISYHLDYKVEDENLEYIGEYVIESRQHVIYNLKIKSISLTVFETYVAVLSIQTENTEYTCLDDIIRINDYGRRLYPAYKTEGDGFPHDLPKTITLKLNNGENIVEDFRNDLIPKHISKLLGENFLKITPIIDDRMFVISYVGHNVIHKLKKYHEETGYSYETGKMAELWHRVVFIDSDSCTCQSKTMLPDLIKSHTYNRWIDSGSLYGMTRYSFILLTDSNSNITNVFRTHIQTMYHQIVILALAQRASILRFSERVSQISSDKNNTEEISKLHKEYIKFVNKIYFNEVTAQEQGIDIYNMLEDHMGNKTNIDDLAGEIKELHEYAELEESKKANKTISFLTIIGAFLVIPTFITGFLGMNVFGNSRINFKFTENIVQWGQQHEFVFWIIIFIVPFVFIFLIKALIIKCLNCFTNFKRRINDK